MGVAALSLVVAGVFANKTAKTNTLATLFYGTSGTPVQLSNPGCLLSIFTTTNPGTGYVQAKIEEGTNSFKLYGYITLVGYVPVYNNKF